LNSSMPVIIPRVVTKLQVSPAVATNSVATNSVAASSVAVVEEDEPRIIERRRRPATAVAPSAVAPSATETSSGTPPAVAPATPITPSEATSVGGPSAAASAPAATVPEAPGPSAGGVEAVGANELANGAPPLSGRRPLSVSVDTRLGFDKSTVIVETPAPLGVEVRRRIAAVSLTASYPLGRRTDFSVSVPFIDQTIDARANGQTLKQRGRGVGDISLFLQQRFPQGNTDFSISGGLVTPTGRDPFEVGPGELPTGNGFYEALLRLSVSKMRVPLRFFASLDYGKALARTVGGQRFRVPDQYGGEIGFFYTMGPEFTSQTSISYAKVTSPFLLAADSSVAYLTQALSYQTATATVLRGSVDIGLTEDSTDAYFNFSLNKEF
ncbi:MAG: hypothetical protein JWN98_2043, partial [Abditibacteriota bacterium]|nr:hypothetical protein [Abditibacteriota bacterium]